MKKADAQAMETFSRLFGTVFDKKRHYVLLEYAEGNGQDIFRYMREKGFKFQFLDGCFYPYLMTR